MTLGSLAGQTCQFGGTVADGGRDAAPVEPLSPLHDGVEVEILGQSLGNRRMGAVVDDLRRTHRGTGLSVVQTHAIATASHKVGVHTIATQGVHGYLANLVLRQLRNEVSVVPIIGQAYGYIGLTTARDDAE